MQCLFIPHDLKTMAQLGLRVNEAIMASVGAEIGGTVTGAGSPGDNMGLISKALF